MISVFGILSVHLSIYEIAVLKINVPITYENVGYRTINICLLIVMLLHHPHCFIVTKKILTS